ncbi:hypothetical protein D3C80_1460330 [compost metagenome]
MFGHNNAAPAPNSAVAAMVTTGWEVMANPRTETKIARQANNRIVTACTCLSANSARPRANR